MRRLHAIIFWSHLLAGVIGGIVIFIMAATGFILMYEHQMVEFAERDVRELVPPKANAPRLSLDEIIAGARATNPDTQPTGIVLRNRPEAAVAVGFGRNGTTYVNPYTGEVLGKGSQLHDWFHKSSTGTDGSAEKAKVERRRAPSPARAIWGSSGSRSAASISGGRAAGTGED